MDLKQFLWFFLLPLFALCIVATLIASLYLRRPQVPVKPTENSIGATNTSTTPETVINAAATNANPAKYTNENNPETRPAQDSHPAAVLKTSSATFSGGPLISFSFDDGWESAYTQALPILDRAGFKATFYIISTRIGTPLHITKAQLLEMQQNGDEIGAHTRRHPNLAQLSDAQAEQEIAGSKQDLLGIGIRDVSTFAYPLGAYNSSTPALVKAAGLIGARSSGFGMDTDASDPYLLTRFNLTASTTLDSIKSDIDFAQKNKQWMIFEAHHIDESGFDNISSTLFQQIVDYIEQKHMRVATVRDGLIMLNNAKK